MAGDGAVADILSDESDIREVAELEQEASRRGAGEEEEGDEEDEEGYGAPGTQQPTKVCSEGTCALMIGEA